MGKLILHRARLRAVLLMVAGLTLSATFLPHPRSAMADDPPGDKDLTAVRDPATEDFIWVSQVRDHIHRLSQEDTIPRSRILEEVSRVWHSKVASQPTDSLLTPDALIEKLFRHQIDHITSLLSGPAPHQDTSGTGMNRRLDEAARAINELLDLSPLALATRDSIRSSLLVISSVGCRYELARCSSMATLFASMQSDTLIDPIAMVDLMQVPPLEHLLGQVTIPYWILFSENGIASTLIEGASDAEEVRASVVSWLDIPHGDSDKED